MLEELWEMTRWITHYDVNSDRWEIELEDIKRGDKEKEIARLGQDCQIPKDQIIKKE